MIYNTGEQTYKIKENLLEVDEIFKKSIEPSISFPGKMKSEVIFVNAIYTGKNNRPSSYIISIMDSDKYHFKVRTRTEAKEKVKSILKDEGFKRKK